MSTSVAGPVVIRPVRISFGPRQIAPSWMDIAIGYAFCRAIRWRKLENCRFRPSLTSCFNWPSAHGQA